MKKISSIKHITVFIALSMFLLILSGTALAVSNGNKKYTVSGCSYTTETYCYGQWCSGDVSCASCTQTTESTACTNVSSDYISGTATRTRSVTSACGSCSYSSWSSWITSGCQKKTICHTKDIYIGPLKPKAACEGARNSFTITNTSVCNESYKNKYVGKTVCNGNDTVGYTVVIQQCVCD